VNGDGIIDYEEFLAATINRSKLEREELLRQVGPRGGGVASE
jgi:calcium-dependent protein kinase